MLTTIVDARTGQRVKTTALSVTSKRRSGSIPNSRPRSKRLASSFEPAQRGTGSQVSSRLSFRRLRLLEISQIRRRLVLLGGHQEPIAAEEIGVNSDDH